jgi:hypothetical protein
LPKTLLADHVGVPTFLTLASYRYQTDGAYPGDAANQVNAFLAANGAEYEIENTPATLSGVGRDAISSSDILQTVGSGYVAMGADPDNTLGAGLQQSLRSSTLIWGGSSTSPTAASTTSGEDVDTTPARTFLSVQAFFADLDGHGKSRSVLGDLVGVQPTAPDNGSNGADNALPRLTSSWATPSCRSHECADLSVSTRTATLPSSVFVPTTGRSPTGSAPARRILGAGC